MPSVNVTAYDESMAGRWDRFVLEDSFNGTFLQTRRFLGYHPEGRFCDDSLVAWKGTSEILAVIPGARVVRDGRACYVSHPGSTFGGPVISKRFYNIAHVEALMDAFEAYLGEAGYDSCTLRPASQAFSSMPCDLLDYFLFQRGWGQSSELSSVVDLRHYSQDIVSNFTSKHRNHYRNGAKAGLVLREIREAVEIDGFYAILRENLMKYGAKPVHSRADLDELASRLGPSVRFYGCYNGDEMVAGSMDFLFGRRVFHAQYLSATKRGYSLHASEFMDGQLISIALEEGFESFSFGISTEDHGHVLNRSLAEFKESFGSSYCVNKAYAREF